MERTPFLKLEGREKELDEFYEVSTCAQILFFYYFIKDIFFVKVMYGHRNLMHQTADLIMRLLAEAGEEDPNYFEPMFSDCPLHTFRPLQYPKRVDNIPQGAYLPDGRSN